MTGSRETRGKARQEELSREHEHENKKQKVETRGRSKAGKKQEKHEDGVETDVDEQGNEAAAEDLVEQFEEFVDELKEHCPLEELKAIAEENKITPDLPPRMLLRGL